MDKFNLNGRTMLYPLSEKARVRAIDYDGVEVFQMKVDRPTPWVQIANAFHGLDVDLIDLRLASPMPTIVQQSNGEFESGANPDYQAPGDLEARRLRFMVAQMIQENRGAEKRIAALQAAIVMPTAPQSEKEAAEDANPPA